METGRVFLIAKLFQNKTKHDCISSTGEVKARINKEGGKGGVPITHHAEFLSEITHHGENF